MGTNTNIQPDHEYFIGREAEIRTLERALLDGERLLSIIGPSGAGKTRLARQVALRLLPELGHAGGVWFCDLSAAQTKEDLLALVAVTLGIPGVAGQHGAGADLARTLANHGSMLLVLDNIEHLEPGALPILAGWISQAPRLQLLVTSLASLGLAGESLFELGALQDEEAIALYEHCANKAWAGVRTFFSGEQRAVGELMRRLDCLPLAIELAAAQVRVLPPLAMLSRIEDRFDLLQSRKIGRHSSLEYAIFCSWELLEPAERRALARASVFAGGFTLEAAEEVLAPEPDGVQVNVIELLEGLRDKALVQLDGSDPPRFSLYESMQAFATRELERADGTADAKRRHAEFFLRSGEDAGPFAGCTLESESQEPTSCRLEEGPHVSPMSISYCVGDCDPSIDEGCELGEGGSGGDLDAGGSEGG